MRVCCGGPSKVDHDSYVAESRLVQPIALHGESHIQVTVR
jgi:hypothetical protein